MVLGWRDLPRVGLLEKAKKKQCIIHLILFDTYREEEEKKKREDEGEYKTSLCLYIMS